MPSRSRIGCPSSSSSSNSMRFVICWTPGSSYLVDFQFSKPGTDRTESDLNFAGRHIRYDFYLLGAVNGTASGRVSRDVGTAYQPASLPRNVGLALDSQVVSRYLDPWGCPHFFTAPSGRRRRWTGGCPRGAGLVVRRRHRHRTQCDSSFAGPLVHHTSWTFSFQNLERTGLNRI